MKIRKRLMCLVLAVMLTVAMAVPASAYSVVMGRSDGSFQYYTSDTCYMTHYSCVIESDSPEYTIRTDVYVRKVDINGSFISQNTYRGTEGTLLANNARTTGATIDYINCYHYIGGAHRSTQRVEP